MCLTRLLASFLLVVFAVRVEAAELALAPNISKAVHSPWSHSFGVERKAGVWQLGDSTSFFTQNTPELDRCTFDVSNGTTLANMGATGAIRTLTMYRDGYRAMTSGWPGVWMGKDCATYGAYAFTMDYEDKHVELAGALPSDKPDPKKQAKRVDWDLKVGLLDNMIPIAELNEPAGKFKAYLVLYTPVSADGKQRPQGAIYGLLLENTGSTPFKATVHLPKCSGSNNAATSGNWAQKDTFDFELTSADPETLLQTTSKVADGFDAQNGAGSGFTPDVKVNLPPGSYQWITALFYAPDEAVLAEFRTHTSLEWLKQTDAYLRSVTGRLEIKRDPFYGELYERQVILALESLDMKWSDEGGGQFVGSNWGSYEATRMTWMKDCFYSSLPFSYLEPDLGRQEIEWFTQYGVRPRGTRHRGGINHSISLSAAGLMLAANYYSVTGDKEFFQKHPALRQKWDQIVQGLVDSQTNKEIYLFPSDYISDGGCGGEYHMGSNIAVWHGLKGYSRLLAEAYEDPKRATEVAEVADKMKNTLLTQCPATWQEGKYWNETMHKDGSPGQPFHDGEESDTTLAPVYGLVGFDDPLYLSTMHFALSPANPNYPTNLYGLAWRSASTTSPGYNKAIAGNTDEASLFSDHGGLNEYRKVIDADGSVWWWSYGFSGKAAVYGHLTRATAGIGKAGWTEGVFSTLFFHKFLGVRYDAPQQTLYWSPLPALGDFRWNDFPQGRDRFSVARQGSSYTVENPNGHPLQVVATVLGGANTHVTANGAAVPAKELTYFGAASKQVQVTVESGKTVKIEVAP